MTPAPLVLIIVLNWDGQHYTLDCLESLEQLSYPNFEVLVVDNGSSDDSAAVISARFPHRLLIETGENLGFAGGNNVGLRYALEQGADYALLLNNDTLVAPDFLGQLVEATEADPMVGIAGPTIYYYECPDLIWSAGGAIDWRRGKTEMVGLNTRDNGQFETTSRPVDFVTGCALLVKRAVMKQAGLLDERFFVYYEETEWCVRAQRAGFKIIHVPQAKIWHKIPLDARDSSPVVHYYMTRNRLLFLKATNAGLRPWLHTLLAEYLRILISWTLRPKRRHKRAQRDVMLMALRDYFLKRFGHASIG